MSIDPNHADDEVLVGRFVAELATVDDAEQAIARMREPITPSGGKHEKRMKTELKRAKKARDTVRQWTPALAGTVVFLALLFSPMPMTGPLIVYALSMAGFGIWTSLGRPGLRPSAAMTARGALAVWALLVNAAVAVYGFIRRAARVRAAQTRQGRPAVAK